MKRLLPLVLVVLLAVACGSAKKCAGTEVVLRAVSTHPGEPVTRAGMELALAIINSRVDTIGVVSAHVTIRGDDEIVVDFASKSVSKLVTKRLTGVISATGQLQFFDFEKDLAPPTVVDGNPTPFPTLYDLLTRVKSAASTGTPEAYYLLDASAPHRVLAGPAGTRSALLRPYGKQRPGATILAVPANEEVVSGMQEMFTASTEPVERSPDGRYWYLFRLPAELSGSDLKETSIAADSDQTGAPEVQLGFTSHGEKAFQALTKAEYDRGRLVAGLHGASMSAPADVRYVQHNAVVLDNRLEAIPYIDYTDNALSLGIAGNAVISNMRSTVAAQDLALVLQSGSLPYRFVRVSVCHA